jgi:O-antigen ligase
MTVVGPGRRNLVGAFGAAAALVLGCFTVGVFAARTSTEGLLLIAALGCLVVYLTDRRWMVWIALILAFASLPSSLHVAKMVGPMTVYAYQVAVALAIAFLIPLARLKLSSYVLPGQFLLVALLFGAFGIASGHDAERVLREMMFLYDVAAGSVLALLIVRIGYVRESMRAMAVVLWFSAGMILMSSVTGLRLAGRAESLEETTGAPAIRLLTATQVPALVVLTALVAAHIIGRARPSVSVALGVPALLITVLSFSRNTLIALAVAAVVALVASWTWSAVSRTAVLAAGCAVLLGIALPAMLFLLQNTTAAVWLSDQLNAFSHRVIGGVSTAALAVDSSTLARLHENTNLIRAIAEAPLYGHGLGYAYQMPFGKSGSFSATLGTTYAHNFYLWLLVKSGVIGMASFAVFAVTPVWRAVRSSSAAAKISAATGAALLAICVFDPLPLEPANSLALGMALGAAMGFAR